ncbi:PREDICTED: tetrahydrocannabinolic acid synthase isoform X1 [Theobroma cacao]|uniref:Tetrahydrocannabinolic acid synthase isoform X1 n=1 Tax=Theobroma cacao TaxID=3641 RepID=A0AB32WHA4_THECC|nr:PREDICTED: tetrahydrocannabinolic acid synthase isoform X1 [Theobroma cacao]XP_017978142.1 PREDICTED: tetrahydrocannabinolic acid synthase isoform X1 [Theobroma cacao]
MSKMRLDGQLLVCTIFPILFFVSSASPDLLFYGAFYQCIAFHSPFLTQVHDLLHSAHSPEYLPILQSSIQNLRFNSSVGQRPRYIITPRCADHLRAAVLCSKYHGLQVRIRSGGHDYEGLSYKANTPFVLIDLFYLRKVTVDLKSKTAWVGAGATLGELYYQIANRSQTLGFPAGICSSIGVGGHLSGGGQGTLMRKFGLAADNIVDAILVNADGNILDRRAMGENLFWAIRGGGAASFGVIVEWKVKLVPVPPKVTAFNVPITLQQGATSLIHRWQQIATRLPEDLFIRILLTVGKESDGRTTVRAIFNSLYLGPLHQLFPLIDEKFPELGLHLQEEHCKELSWIESVLFLDRGFAKGKNVDVLTDRKNNLQSFFIAKSDFVNKPITKRGLKAIWNVMQEGEAGIMIWDPYGGKMDEIPQDATPFPHRAGTLYNIQYFTNWKEGGPDVETKRTDWINKLYNFMEPYVSQNPRAAYLNYRDLSLGINNKYGSPSYLRSKVWGEKYFKNNFERLARVKHAVDPGNFFRNEQSIPPYSGF